MAQSLVLGLSLLFLGQASSTFTPCVGDKSVYLGNDKCYSLFLQQKNPLQAYKLCLQQNGVLATIGSQADNDKLQKLLNASCTDAQIGFIRIKFLGTYDFWATPLGTPPSLFSSSSAAFGYKNLVPEFFTQMCSFPVTFSYMGRADGKWRQNCFAPMAYVCSTPKFDPCTQAGLSQDWVNVEDRCFKLLKDKERKGAEYVCSGLEPHGKAVMYDFDDDKDFVKEVLKELDVLPQSSSQQSEFWLSERPIYDGYSRPDYGNSPRPNYDNDGHGYDGYRGKRDADSSANGYYQQGYDDDNQRNFKGDNYNYQRYDNHPTVFKGYDNHYNGPDFKGYNDKGYDRDNNKGYNYDKGYDRDNNKGYNYGNDKGYDRDNNKGYNYDNDKGYDRDNSKGYNTKAYDNDHKGYDNKKGYKYPLKCLAGVVKGTNPVKFSVEKESCKEEYDVICELKVLPPSPEISAAAPTLLSAEAVLAQDPKAEVDAFVASIPVPAGDSN